jgi:hypothetical protein
MLEDEYYKTELGLFEERIREFIAVCKYHERPVKATVEETVARTLDKEGK